MTKSIARLATGILIAGSLAACGEREDGVGSLEPEYANSVNPSLIECPTNTAYETEATLLPAGGTVALRGHSVALPLGAVLDPTVISLREPQSQFMMIDLGANGQDHFQFLEQLTVTISYARCSRSNIDRGALSVWLVDPATGELLQNMGGVDDKVSRTITFRTDHFSGYAIAN